MATRELVPVFQLVKEGHVTWQTTDREATAAGRQGLPRV